MENNDFKNLWKSAVDKHARPYSEDELNVMVVKSAKKSMRKLHPRWETVSCIIVAGYLLWEIIYKTGNLQLTILFSFLLMLSFASLSLLSFSIWKMNQYKTDMPVKEWLKYRIAAIDKSIRFKKKYGIYINVGTIIFCIGLNVLFCYILYHSFYSFVAATAASLSVLVIILLLRKNRYNQVRNYLQSLYEQIDK